LAIADRVPLEDVQSARREDPLPRLDEVVGVLALHISEFDILLAEGAYCQEGAHDESQVFIQLRWQLMRLKLKLLGNLWVESLQINRLFRPEYVAAIQY